MSNEIVPANQTGPTIQTTTGEIIPANGLSALDFITPSAGREPIYRLQVTQGHRDRNLPGKPDTFYLSRKVRHVDEQGKTSYVPEIVELGAAVDVYPLGVALNRVMFPKYDPENPSGPLCRSETYFEPDAKYAGLYSTACCKYDPARRQLVPACPMAQWGKHDNGKPKPPACTEVYVIFAAVSVDRGNGPEMVLAECHFKAASAAGGKALSLALKKMADGGVPLWTHPVSLIAKPAGVGTTYVPSHRTDITPEFTEDDTAAFAAAKAEIDATIEYRISRSKQANENEPDETQATPSGKAPLI